MMRWLLLTCALSVIPVTTNALPTYSTKPIVYIDNKITYLTFYELRDIFMLNVTQWDDGTKIVVVTFPMHHPLLQAFIWDYFGLTPSRYNEQIMSSIRAGKTPPIIVGNEFEMINKVGAIRGSIGFIGSTILLHSDDGVKSISTEKLKGLAKSF